MSVISYSGQCPFLKVRRDVEIRTEIIDGKETPVENLCEMEDDCSYWVGCPVFETCKKDYK